MSAQAAREKYTKFDPKVRQILQQISEYLKRMNITLNQLFEKMDADRNGQLSRDEFVMSMP
jgi:Ca2+-binding EF-hand superfamily protein